MIVGKDKEGHKTSRLTSTFIYWKIPPWWLRTCDRFELRAYLTSEIITRLTTPVLLHVSRGARHCDTDTLWYHLHTGALGCYSTPLCFPPSRETQISFHNLLFPLRILSYRAQTDTHAHWLLALAEGATLSGYSWLMLMEITLDRQNRTTWITNCEGRWETLQPWGTFNLFMLIVTNGQVDTQC